MINQEKLKKLKTANALLDEEYGKNDTESRKEFNAKAQAWYYAELLREERKKQHMSQGELASIIGKSRTYITSFKNRHEREKRNVITLLTFQIQRLILPKKQIFF